jgi:hypothetical protein
VDRYRAIEREAAAAVENHLRALQEAVASDR